MDSKKRKNQSVVVEGGETGEIDECPCVHRRFPWERPEDGGHPFVESGSFSPISRAWGKEMVVIGRFQPPVFPRQSQPGARFSWAASPIG